MAKQTTEIVKTSATENYLIMQPEVAADLMEAINDSIGTGQFSFRDLTTIKVPSGGALVWSWPNPATGEAESEKSIVGIIVHAQDTRACWMSDGDPDNSPPDCYSADGVTGNPSTPFVESKVNKSNCAKCPMNQFSDDAGASKCKPSKNLFVLRENNSLPVVIRLPRMSIKPCKTYFLNGLLNENMVAYYGVISEIGLSAERNKKSQVYSAAKFRMVEKLDKGSIETVKSYREAIANLIQRDGGDLAAGQSADSDGPSFDDQDAAPVAYDDDVE